VRAEPHSVVSQALYVHLPFCPYICPYCDFAKMRWDAGPAATYLAALRAEIAATPASQGTTLFFGGGTPNTYAAADLAALVDLLRERFALRDDAEITFEANPDPELCTGFSALRAAGATRLSFGVQSFVSEELRALGRRHTPADVAEAVARARAAGFANLSLDLMFGVPRQTEESWRASLAATLLLAPEHVSTYGLTIEDDTPYKTWFDREPQAFFDDTREARLYEIAIETLEAAGYEHYEISNFAKPGYRSQHNATYWKNDEYLGFGIGAASYVGGVRSVHTRDLAAYAAAAAAGAPIPGESERLDDDERVGEAAMLALRTREGVDFADFRERYAVDMPSRYAAVLADLSAAGLAIVDDVGVRLSARGRFVANDVCGAFLA
jgi:oxygen-independent coproporphyrinogen-3 oxidase